MGPSGSIFEQIVKPSNTSLYIRLWERMNKYPNSFYNDWNVDMKFLQKMLQSSNRACILSYADAEVLLSQMPLTKDDNSVAQLYIAKEPVFAYYSRIAMTKSLPCLDLLNAEIRLLYERGTCYYSYGSVTTKII